jgi:hypothetical protein
MAVLGKRKTSKVSKASEPSISAEEANEIFRRHFEAQFAPLEDSNQTTQASRKRKNDDDDEDNVGDSEESSDGGENNSDKDEVQDVEDEWGGLSDDDEDDEDGEEVSFREMNLSRDTTSNMPFF